MTHKYLTAETIVRHADVAVAKARLKFGNAPIDWGDVYGHALERLALYGSQAKPKSVDCEGCGKPITEGRRRAYCDLNCGKRHRHALAKAAGQSKPSKASGSMSVSAGVKDRKSNYGKLWRVQPSDMPAYVQNTLNADVINYAVKLCRELDHYSRAKHVDMTGHVISNWGFA